MTSEHLRHRCTKCGQLIRRADNWRKVRQDRYRHVVCPSVPGQRAENYKGRGPGE